MKTSLKLSLALALVAGVAALDSSCAKATPDPLNDLSSRQPLAAQKFAENGFEIIGQQNSYDHHRYHDDCYTLKQTPDTGQRYEGCADFRNGKGPLSISVTGLNLKR